MRRFLWMGLVLIVVIGLALGLIYKFRPAKHKIDVAKIEKDIRDHLPLGTARSEVVAYLDQRGIEHSYSEGSKEYPEFQHIEGVVIEISQTWLIRSDLHITFQFDEHDRLIRCSFQKINTGP